MVHRRWLWLGICFRLDTAPSRHGPPMVSALRGGTIRKFKQATQAKANAPIGFKPGRCDGVDRGTMWRQYRSNRQFAAACPASPTFSTQFSPPKETLRTILPMRGNGGEACSNLTLAATLRFFPSRSRRARNPIGYARRGGGSCQPAINFSQGSHLRSSNGFPTNLALTNMDNRRPQGNLCPKTLPRRIGERILARLAGLAHTTPKG